MKRFFKILLCIFNLLSINIIALATQDPTKLFIGTVQFPTTLDFDLCLYYKGQKVDTDCSKKDPHVQFSFLESKYTQEMFILICENISYHTENNTIQNLRVTDNSYKCFKLSATRIYDNHNDVVGFSWDAQECELEEKIVPDNTLFFVFNPDLIQGLSVQSWKTDNTLRIIPTITINQIASAEQLKRAMTIARLAAIDIDTVHKKNNHQSVQSQSAQALLTLIQ